MIVILFQPMLAFHTLSILARTRLQLVVTGKGVGGKRLILHMRGSRRIYTFAFIAACMSICWRGSLCGLKYLVNSNLKLTNHK